MDWITSKAILSQKELQYFTNLKPGITLISAGKLSQKEIVFGTSKEFVKSAVHALEGKTIFAPNDDRCNLLETAAEVASCGYEYGTAWGEQVRPKVGALQFPYLSPKLNIAPINA